MFVLSKINGSSPKESNSFHHFTKRIEAKGVIPIWMKQIQSSYLKIRRSVLRGMKNRKNDRGVKQGKEFAILTDEITRAWAGLSTRQYKNLRGQQQPKIVVSYLERVQQ